MRPLLALLITAHVALAAVPLPGLRQNILYLDSGMSNQLAVLVNRSSSSGKTLQLGPGTFNVNVELDCVPNLTIRGMGRDVTTIVGNATAVLWPNDNLAVSDLTIRSVGPNVFPVQFFNYCTNVSFHNVGTRGNIDNYYFDAGSSRLGLICRIRNCVIESGWDAIFFQSNVSDATLVVEDTSFYMDALFDTGGVNTARALQPFSCAGGGTIEANNLRVVTTNGLAGRLFSVVDTPIAGFRARFGNVSMFHVVTNGGRVLPYELSRGTNSFVFYQNVPQITTVTNTVAYTNLFGPETVIMTSAVARTNWLPNISFNGVERYNFPVTIKDGNGNAAAANIQVEATGGATIDGAARVAITANYGSITVQPRPGTTNWMVVSRGQ